MPTEIVRHWALNQSTNTSTHYSAASQCASCILNNFEEQDFPPIPTEPSCSSAISRSSFLFLGAHKKQLIALGSPKSVGVSLGHVQSLRSIASRATWHLFPLSVYRSIYLPTYLVVCLSMFMSMSISVSISISISVSIIICSMHILSKCIGHGGESQEVKYPKKDRGCSQLKLAIKCLMWMALPLKLNQCVFRSPYILDMPRTCMSSPASKQWVPLVSPLGLPMIPMFDCQRISNVAVKP